MPIGDNWTTFEKSDKPSEFGYGSHLYLKGRVFYFRYVLPKKLRAVFGKNEIHLTLNTPYRKEAVLLSQRLFSVLLDYKEGIRLPSHTEPAKQLFSELNSLVENPELRRVEDSLDDTRLRFQSLIEKLQSSTQESSPTTPQGAVGELFALFLPLREKAYRIHDMPFRSMCYEDMIMLLRQYLQGQ